MRADCHILFAEKKITRQIRYRQVCDSLINWVMRIVNRILELTVKFITDLYRDHKGLAETLLHPRAVGLMEDGNIAEGKENIIKYLNERLESSSGLFLMSPECRLVGERGELGVTICRYRLNRGPENGHGEQILKHTTMVWCRTGDKIRLLHLHISSFPQTQNFNVNRHKTAIKDGKNHTCFLPEEDIYYVKACDVYCRLYCRMGEIVIRNTLTELEHSFSGLFIRIHRSYLINSSHVSELFRDRVKLGENICLPVSAGRADMVRELLRNRK